MNEKTLVSTCTLIGSLAAYYYGKRNHRDVVPYSMIGAFIGAWVGEILAKTINQKEKKETDGNQQ